MRQACAGTQCGLGWQGHESGKYSNAMSPRVPRRRWSDNVGLPL